MSLKLESTPEFFGVSDSEFKHRSIDNVLHVPNEKKFSHIINGEHYRSHNIRSDSTENIACRIARKNPDIAVTYNQQKHREITDILQYKVNSSYHAFIRCGSISCENILKKLKIIIKHIRQQARAYLHVRYQPVNQTILINGHEPNCPTLFSTSMVYLHSSNKYFIRYHTELGKIELPIINSTIICNLPNCYLPLDSLELFIEIISPSPIPIPLYMTTDVCRLVDMDFTHTMTLYHSRHDALRNHNHPIQSLICILHLDRSNRYPDEFNDRACLHMTQSCDLPLIKGMSLQSYVRQFFYNMYISESPHGVPRLVQGGFFDIPTDYIAKKIEYLASLLIRSQEELDQQEQEHKSHQGQSSLHSLIDEVQEFIKSCRSCDERWFLTG